MKAALTFLLFPFWFFSFAFSFALSFSFALFALILFFCFFGKKGKSKLKIISLLFRCILIQAPSDGCYLSDMPARNSSCH